MSLQANIHEVAIGLRKALKRKPYYPDSDAQITVATNRGYKDLVGAHVVRLGQLASSSGLTNEVIEYGGLKREIISQKPPLVDQDGYVVDSDDEPEHIQEAMALSAQFDPYANIRIDEILAPLTAITDLPTHPTLNRPFISTVLTQLSDQSSAIMRKENQSLWKTKRLYTRLCGDLDWAPCGLMVTPASVMGSDDFAPGLAARHTDGSNATGSTTCRQGMDPTLAQDIPRRPLVGDGIGGSINGHARTKTPNHVAKDRGDEDVIMTAVAMAGVVGPGAIAAKTDDVMAMEQESQNDSTDAGRRMPPSKDSIQQPQPQSISTDSAHKVHPLFQPPPNARPDRNVNLPDDEAETLRKLLMMWVQKQEEVCRGMARLNNGLLKADRLRQETLHWAKAEAHCGPNRDISDGEDWYDKERWGLVEDLKKGDDDAEEEEVGPSAKKTRNRR